MTLNIIPRGPARMTRFSKFSPESHAYHQWQLALSWEAKRVGYTLSCPLSLCFYLPMPQSWSKKKREAMRGQPHTQKPDLDNCIKSFTDGLSARADDAHIWCYGTMEKRWADTGSIEILKNDER